jgi:hypothetical protein
MDEEEIEFEPEELIDKPLYYLIYIKSAKIPINYKDIYVEYSVKVNEAEWEKHQTDVVNALICRFMKRRTILNLHIANYTDTKE